LQAKGHDVKIGDLLTEIRARDDRDTNRAVAPMVAAEDAIEVDSTEISAQEVFDQLIKVVKEKF